MLALESSSNGPNSKPLRLPGFFGKRHLARHTQGRLEGGLTRNHFNVNITPY